MEAIINFFKRLFGADTTPKTQVPSVVHAPPQPTPVVVTPVVPAIPTGKKKVPSRTEMTNVFIGMIEGDVKTRIGAYEVIRESHGKNRSPAIDSLIKAQGGSLGEPYCQYGMQEVLDELCRYYGVVRKAVRLPEGGSTQSVFEGTPKEFKRTEPAPMRWITWRNGTSWTGHVGMIISAMVKKTFRTFEFNTSVRIDGGVERDGQGASYLERTPNAMGNMKVRGYVDVYDAIVEAMIKSGDYVA